MTKAVLKSATRPMTGGSGCIGAALVFSAESIKRNVKVVKNI